jgi:CheY-like chemotaxis protein
MDALSPGTPQYRPRCDLTVAALRIGRRAWRRDSAVSTSSPVILVVEDEWVLRQLLVDELRGAGWSVSEANSGEQALAILERGETIGILVTDIRLGGDVDGWDVAAAFREVNGRLPVIYVSANPASDPRRVDGSVFLSKPCAMEHLLQACRTLCPT